MVSTLLLAFENGTKVSSIDVTENWNSLATTSLVSTLSTITSKVEPFTTGTRSIDFNYLSPLVTFLVYKAAMITTERLSIHVDVNNGLERVRTLRKFLKMMAKRWLSCGKLNRTSQKLFKLTEVSKERYLKLLNEDTTPRMLKAIEQGQQYF